MASSIRDPHPCYRKLAKDGVEHLHAEREAGNSLPYPDLAPVLRENSDGEIRGREVRFTPQELLEVV